MLPVTGESIHHTIPMLAAKLLRHEHRLDDLLGVIEEISLERVEGMQRDVRDLIVSRLAMDHIFEVFGRELEESRELIAETGRRLDVQRRESEDLREIAVITQQMLEHQTQELSAASATIYTLVSILDQIQTREMERDREMLGMMAIVRDLQRRSGGAP